jgi:hypothetical protein
MLFPFERWAGVFRVGSCGILTSVAIFVQTAQAGSPPLVEFDLPPTAVCRTVTAAETISRHPGAKLVEVAFDLSTRVVAGNEADIKHITVEIRSPDRQLLLVGFLPATTLLSESSNGFIEVEQHKAAGQIAIEYGVPSAKIQASAKNAGDSKIVEKKLAPKSLLISATTIDRSHGVVFRLHPSSQDSLEKSRQFVCQFAVPATFRGDYVQLTCSAVGHNRGAMRSLDTEVSSGSAQFTVGIYLDGNADAKRAAEVLAERQEALASLVVRQADLSKQKKTPAWWHTVSQTMLNVSHAKSQPTADDISADNLAFAIRSVERAQIAIRALNGQPVAE